MGNEPSKAEEMALVRKERRDDEKAQLEMKMRAFREVLHHQEMMAQREVQREREKMAGEMALQLVNMVAAGARFFMEKRAEIEAAAAAAAAQRHVEMMAEREAQREREKGIIILIVALVAGLFILTQWVK